MSKTYAAPAITTSGNVVRETKSSGPTVSTKENQFVMPLSSNGVGFGL